MALQLKQSLSLSQQLIMTPQLQQAIKLLQLSRLELLETINQEMETNPLLDEQSSGDSDGDSNEIVDEIISAPEEPPTKEITIEENVRHDEVDWESYLSEYNTGWADTPYQGKEAPAFENMNQEKTSLNSHLMWQLSLSHLTEQQREIGIQIIGNIDDDGYLQITTEELVESTGYSEEEVLYTLSAIQNFDPVGVAARDTRECLLIQARFQGLDGSIVEKIIMEHMENLENKRYDKIAKNLSITIPDVLKAVEIITNLEPKPGRLYSEDDTIYISPDIYVFKVGDDYEIVLNEDGLPKLKINNYYKEILNDSDSSESDDKTKEYILDKMKSAAWLIKSIHQRQRTIYKVTESIVQFQRKFFDHGVTHLKPLVLRDVAEHIQMHESTISRVTTNKYVHTPQGVFELKYFFNSAINSMEGDSIASESVKEHIRNIIKSENKSKPFSDQEVADLLKNHNIDVARRTVAKYRETLGILPSRKRREPF
ncbi:MAG: RNA polymerase factor sigma-54 [Deltaproteobacteria bacterium]|nr:RNA polymerase factor sigma-54 [Deltaproteobacteria bacterium]